MHVWALKKWPLYAVALQCQDPSLTRPPFLRLSLSINFIALAIVCSYKQTLHKLTTALILSTSCLGLLQSLGIYWKTSSSQGSYNLNPFQKPTTALVSLNVIHCLYWKASSSYLAPIPMYLALAESTLFSSAHHTVFTTLCQPISCCPPEQQLLGTPTPIITSSGITACLLQPCLLSLLLECAALLDI